MSLCGMAASSKIVDLRNLLTERFPQSFTQRSTHIATGVPPLDEATGGGLPAGAITELVISQPSAGGAALIYALLDAAQRDRFFLALIDGRDSFDPSGLAGSTRLQHLLWVRCSKAMEAIKAADLLLRDGNFRLVLLDLGLNAADELRRIPQTNWYRLQRLIEPAPTALLVLTRQTMISSAQLKLVLENRWTLADVDRDYAPARLTIRIARVHGATNALRQTG